MSHRAVEHQDAACEGVGETRHILSIVGNEYPDPADARFARWHPCRGLSRVLAGRTAARCSGPRRERDQGRGSGRGRDESRPCRRNKDGESAGTSCNNATSAGIAVNLRSRTGSPSCAGSPEGRRPHRELPPERWRSSARLRGLARENRGSSTGSVSAFGRTGPRAEAPATRRSCRRSAAHSITGSPAAHPSAAASRSSI